SSIASTNLVARCSHIFFAITARRPSMLGSLSLHDALPISRRLLSGPAGARVGARARPPGHRRGRAGDLLRDTRGCAVRGAVHGDGHLRLYPVLQVQGLVNRFGTQVVHDGLDMEVRADEVFGVVGGSGSGKSVLLRTILGLQRPIAGVVRIDGGDITRMSEAQLRSV